MRKHTVGETVSGVLLGLLLALPTAAAVPAAPHLWHGLVERPGHEGVDGEVGPGIDPYGTKVLPKMQVGPGIDPYG